MISFDALELNKKEPVYLQLKNYIKKKILANEIRDYDELPSRRESAVTLSINPNTVQKAFKQLEEEGIIRTINNVKSVVVVNEDILNAIREELLDERMKVFVNECKESGFDFQQVITVLTNLWSE